MIPFPFTLGTLEFGFPTRLATFMENEALFIFIDRGAPEQVTPNVWNASSPREKKCFRRGCGEEGHSTPTTPNIHLKGPFATENPPPPPPHKSSTEF